MKRAATRLLMLVLAVAGLSAEAQSRSTPQQVRRALERGLKLAEWSESHRSIFEPLFELMDDNNNNNLYRRHFPAPPTRFPKRQYDSAAVNALTRTKIVIKENGDCGKKEFKHADASVSSLSLEATVCFSIGHLTSITPDVLQREILALILHEAAHMAGAEEEEAQLWQKTFRDFYIWKELVAEDPNEAGFLKQNLEEINQEIEKELLTQKVGDAASPALLKKVGRKVLFMGYEYAYVDLRLNPPRPWLIPNLVNSVLALERTISDQQKGRAAASAPPITLLELKSSVAVIQDNFNGLFSKEPAKQTRCVWYRANSPSYICVPDQPPKP